MIGRGLVVAAAAACFVAACASPGDALIVDLDAAEIAAECRWEADQYARAGVFPGERTCDAYHVTEWPGLDGCIGRLEGWVDCATTVSDRRAWVWEMVGPSPCQAGGDPAAVYGDPVSCEWPRR